MRSPTVDIGVIIILTLRPRVRRTRIESRSMIALRTVEHPGARGRSSIPTIATIGAVAIPPRTNRSVLVLRVTFTVRLSSFAAFAFTFSPASS